jgi:hypothetical protein
MIIFYITVLKIFKYIATLEISAVLKLFFENNGNFDDG